MICIDSVNSWHTSKQGAFSIKTGWGSGRFRWWVTEPTSGKWEMPLCNWQNESSRLCCLKYSDTHESKLNLSLTFEVFIFYILVDLIYKNFLMLLRLPSFIPSYPWVPRRRIQSSAKVISTLPVCWCLFSFTARDCLIYTSSHLFLHHEARSQLCVGSSGSYLHHIYFLSSKCLKCFFFLLILLCSIFLQPK